MTPSALEEMLEIQGANLDNLAFLKEICLAGRGAIFL